jgi:hypothetical protein
MFSLYEIQSETRLYPPTGKADQEMAAATTAASAATRAAPQIFGGD